MGNKGKKRRHRAHAAAVAEEDSPPNGADRSKVVKAVPAATITAAAAAPAQIGGDQKKSGEKESRADVDTKTTTEAGASKKPRRRRRVGQDRKKTDGGGSAAAQAPTPAVVAASSKSESDPDERAAADDPDGGGDTNENENDDNERAQDDDSETTGDNPLLSSQKTFLSALPPDVRQNFFSANHVTPETRAQIWGDQAEVGEAMVNTYAWATPDERAMRIIAHFAQGGDDTAGGKGGKKGKSGGGGVVEIGCGANAYWANMMRRRGIDVLAYDVSVDRGGRITHGDDDAGGGTKKGGGRNRNKRKKKSEEDEGGKKKGRLDVRRGGPEVLGREPLKSSGRALFLCYPDEDLLAPATASSAGSHGKGKGDAAPTSMAAACLQHYTGHIVIHVGELISASAPTPSLDQAPYGRSSSPDFQERLMAEYHCVLQAKLPGWLHVNDTISVWKRSERCEIVFAADSEDEGDEDEEAAYRHIPEEERMPVDCAAPCAAHLLL